MKIASLLRRPRALRPRGAEAKSQRLLLQFGAEAAHQLGWLAVAEGLRKCVGTNTWDEKDLGVAREMLGRWEAR